MSSIASKIRALWTPAAQPEGQSPHEVLPEILHWKKGDALEGPVGIFAHEYEGVLSDGTVVTKWLGRRHSHRVEWVARHAVNRSYVSRKLAARMDGDGEYAALISNFQQAFRELQEADA